MFTRKGFSLVELLVVIAVIASLMSILMPAMSKARLQAKILTVNYELSNIGLALETYAMNNSDKYPPPRTDCSPDAMIHAYALPEELVEGNYLPGGKDGRIKFAKIEDKFNPGCAYKYIAPGQRYDYGGSPTTQSLWIPPKFPASMEGKPVPYDDTAKTGKSPVRWVLFSMGPGYPLEELKTKYFPINKGFPVNKDYWYDHKERKGIITRVKMINSFDYIGTFRKK